MKKTMNTNIAEFEMLLKLQENYFDNLIELGLLYENSGQYDKALDTYQKGFIKAEKTKIDISSTMLELID